ncbi:MAG: hypothetical protein AAB910_01320 [Patescibacteria group bacterium]
MTTEFKPLEFTKQTEDSLNSWRLQNINVFHTNGTDPETNMPLVRKRGWNSVLKPNGGYDLVPETIDSSKTPFPLLILLIPPKLLGTHEATDPDYIPTKGKAKRGFEGIDFSAGWNGSPLAVACFTKCAVTKFWKIMFIQKSATFSLLTATWVF